MQKEINKLREKLLNTKGPGLDGFENYSPLQIAQDTKITKWLWNTVKKLCSRNKAKGMILQHLAKTSERSEDQSIKPHKTLWRVPHRSSQLNKRASRKLECILPHPFQQESKVENYLSQRDMWVQLLSNGVNPMRVIDNSKL